MSKYTPDLQAWFDQTQPIDSGLVPDDSVYLPAAEVKDLILNNAKETAILDLRKGDFTVRIICLPLFNCLLYIVVC